VKETKCIEKNVQIIDVDHFQNEMKKAHVCVGGRLVFLPDTISGVGLFHQNALECSKCHNRTDVSNFPIKHPIRSTVQEPNARLYAPSATTGVGFEAINIIMAFLCLSIPTKKHFLEQTHRIHFDLHQFVQKQFELLVKNIKESANVNDFDSILNICVSIDGTWKKRGHQSMYGIVFLIDADSGYCLDFETLSKRCEQCEGKQRTSTAAQFNRWVK